MSDVVARLLLSFIGTAGSRRPGQPGELGRLVRNHLLAGVLAG